MQRDGNEDGQGAGEDGQSAGETDEQILLRKKEELKKVRGEYCDLKKKMGR